MRSRWTFCCLFLAFLIASPKGTTSHATAADARESDADSDGDGLSDFQEAHKYGTDPQRKVSSNDGVADSESNQRREFTHSVRAVVRVMPQYNIEQMSDDYQDVRVLTETPEYAELEAVVYPLNTNAEAIVGNLNWRTDYAGMAEYLAPGVTTNWDEPMREKLLAELSADGIHPDQLTDKEVVEQVSRWLFKKSRHKNMFCTFYVGFKDDKPYVLPGLEQKFEGDKGDSRWSVEEQFANELFGREMFARKTYGTCTSTAVYQTTVLRALGIPTRMILCIPLADGSDAEQIAMIDRGITHNQVRCDATLGAISGGTSFSSHTFCEVFVGGRWRRLNYTTLGQNVLERNYLGLMIKVHTFNDLSDARLAETWGARYAKGERKEPFIHSNPYRLMEVSDHFGKHATVSNPSADAELKEVTISKAYWADSPDAPEMVRGSGAGTGLGFDDGSHRFFIHCDEWLENAGDYLQYKLFMRRADRKFVLRAKDHPDMACEVSMNFYTHRSKGVCELEVVIPSAEYSKIAFGVEYALMPVNEREGYRWKVLDGVPLKRE
jgi:hypothetical protein